MREYLRKMADVEPAVVDVVVVASVVVVVSSVVVVPWVVVVVDGREVVVVVGRLMLVGVPVTRPTTWPAPSGQWPVVTPSSSRG